MLTAMKVRVILNNKINKINIGIVELFFWTIQSVPEIK